METQANNQEVKAAEATENKKVEGQQDDTKSHYSNIQDALALLCKQFPKCFIAEGEIKPLKLGIFNDLKERIAGIEGLSITKVRAAVRIYTTRLKYLYSIKKDAQRIDLDGNPCGEVSEEHIAHAKSAIEEINKKRKPVKKKRRPNNQARNNQGRSNNNQQHHKHSRPQANVVGADQNLVVGAHVLVVNGDRFIKATVVKAPHKGQVQVALHSGMEISMPLDRVKIEEEK